MCIRRRTFPKRYRHALRVFPLSIPPDLLHILDSIMLSIFSVSHQLLPSILFRMLYKKIKKNIEYTFFRCLVTYSSILRIRRVQSPMILIAQPLYLGVRGDLHGSPRETGTGGLKNGFDFCGTGPITTTSHFKIYPLGFTNVPFIYFPL